MTPQTHVVYTFMPNLWAALDYRTVRARIGSDFDTFDIAWQMVWL